MNNTLHHYEQHKLDAIYANDIMIADYEYLQLARIPHADIVTFIARVERGEVDCLWSQVDMEANEDVMATISKRSIDIFQ